MRFVKSKIAVAVATTAVVALGSTAAYAYFTGTGGGTAQATVTSPAANSFTVIDVPNPQLAIGAPASTIAYTINNSASVSEFASSISVAVDPTWSYIDPAGDPACTAADFAVSGPQTLGYDLAPGPHGIGSTLTVALIDRTTNQDSCEGVNVPLVFSIH